MPLLKGKDKESKKSNLKKLLDEGYPQKQAVAIMYSEAGESKSVKKKPKK